MVKIDELLERKTKRYRTWFDRLSDADQKIALEARKQIREQNLEVLPLAKNYVKRFGLKVTHTTVAIWIRAYVKG